MILFYRLTDGDKTGTIHEMSNFSRSFTHLHFLALSIFLASVMQAGCTPWPAGEVGSNDQTQVGEMFPTGDPFPAIAPSPSPTPTATAILATSVPSPDPPEAGIQSRLCSPLDGVSLEQLAELVSNPFHPPPPGSDDPHHGVDFADIGQDRVAREGRLVSAALPGRVAAVIQDRFPYGNALLLETAMDDLPADLLARLELPVPEEKPEVRTNLTCPQLGEHPVWDTGKVSLYLLYAHLKEQPANRLDEAVECGQVIGAIGGTGNALNPHLHLEARAGFSGARFTSLAHYDPSASVEEMSNYCTWRVSGLFPLVDPLKLLLLVP